MSPDALEAAYPATPVQAGMLFHGLADPSSGRYVEQAIIAMPEAVDIEVFRAAWRRVTARHAVLRTSFDVTEADRPMQLVHRHAEIPISEHDWRGQPRPEQLRRRDRLLRAERDAGFDLRHPPLVRAAVCRVADDETWVLPCFHHAVLDSHGSVIMLGEGFRLYRAMREGEELDLPEPQSFERFARWLTEQDEEAAQRFWRQRLTGVERPTPPPANDAGAVGGEPGARRRRLSAPVVRGLRELTERHGVTLGVTLQAAWALTLSHETGDPDVLFGVVRAGRRSPPFPTEYMMGVTVTTVPTPARVDPDARLAGWLPALHEQAVAVRPWEHTPLLNIQRAAGFPPSQALFATALGFEHGDQRAVLCAIDPAWERREFELLDRPSLPLTIKVSEAGERLVVEALFDGRQVAASTAVRLLGHFCDVLGSFVDRPDARLAEHGPPGRREARRDPTPCLGERRPYERDATVHELFAAQALRTPDAPALSISGRTMTYAELDAAANRVAWRLRSMGVSDEALVAVALPRSFDLVVALLGVVKAGGAYLPLPLDHPPARLGFMLADGGCDVLVTHAGVGDGLPGAPPAVLCLDAEGAALSRERDDAPPASPDTGAESLAYVTYTSGSTGEPKGVEVLHRGVVRLVRGTDYAPFGPAETFLQLAPVAFDASTFEIWGALLNGGRLAIAPAGAPSLQDLRRLIAEEGVTTLWITTGLFHELVDGTPEALEGLRCVMTGGEVLSPQRAREALERLRGGTLLNLYGPTENTTFTTFHPLRAPEDVDGAVPIGRPIPNTHVRVLDPAGRDVPRGAPGELCVGGDGLARGYRGRPELTAERFVADPASDSGRLYRTGDRVRLREDGALEFLGRLDDQVKIRGVRVEPAEVERVLLAHPDIAQAVVTSGPDRHGAVRLVAYLVPHPEAQGGEIDPRPFLARRLPAAMVPGAIVQLPGLPLSPNGKVDRRALPTPSGNGRPHRDRVGPRDDTERELASIWTELLDLPEVGVDDDFFEAGGHSLLTMRLFAEIERRLGVKLPVASIFTARTIADLAGLVEGQDSVEGWRSLVPVATGASRTPFFCVHGAGGEVALFAELGRRVGAERPFYGLQSQGLDGEAPVLETIEEMAALYLAEVRAVQASGPYLLGGMCMGGVVALEMARQLRVAGEEVAFLGVIDSPGPRRLATPGRRAHWLKDRQAHRAALTRARMAKRAGRRARRDALPTQRRVRWQDSVWERGRSLRRAVNRRRKRLRHAVRDARRALYKWRKSLRRMLKQRRQWVLRVLLGRRIEDRSLAQRLRGLATQVHPDDTERRRRRVEVANRAAHRAYVAHPYQGRLTVLHCEESVTRGGRRRYAGWREVGAAGLELLVVPGTHHSMLRPPDVQTLADVLLARLDAAEAPGPELAAEPREPAAAAGRR